MVTACPLTTAAVPALTTADIAIVELAFGATTDEGEKLQLAPVGNPAQESAIVPANCPLVVRLKLIGELGFPCATLNEFADRTPKVKSITRIVSASVWTVAPASLPVA